MPHGRSLSLERGADRVGDAAICKDDAPHPALDGAECGFDLDHHPACRRCQRRLWCLSIDLVDQRGLVVPVMQKARSIGEEEEAVYLKRGGQLESERVAVDVDGDASFTERGWGEYWRVAVLEQE